MSRTYDRLCAWSIAFPQIDERTPNPKIIPAAEPHIAAMDQ